jgi:aminoglycoside phosphotransferase (APT) family kinase protein
MESISILQNRIHSLKSAIRIEEISKGFSSDKKYTVFFNDDKKYLLRICNIEDYERKKTKFKILNEMQKFKVNSPKPIEMGVIKDLGICFNIFSFIEGEDAKILLPKYSEQEQYKIGFESGKDLARMHSFKAPATIKPWNERAMMKHYNYLEAYKTCGVKIKNDEKIILFIERNKEYINYRPNHFQHDDFHLENIIVKDRKYAGVIDFDNYDWGDPFHDFVKIGLLQREVSVPFSIGQIQGYFDNNIPDDFWILYSIYVGMTIFSSVVWSIRKSPEQLDRMFERLYIILEDHQYFELLIPTWFKPEMIFNSHENIIL